MMVGSCETRGNKAVWLRYCKYLWPSCLLKAYPFIDKVAFEKYDIKGLANYKWRKKSLKHGFIMETTALDYIFFLHI